MRDSVFMLRIVRNVLRAGSKLLMACDLRTVQHGDLQEREGTPLDRVHILSRQVNQEVTQKNPPAVC